MPFPLIPVLIAAGASIIGGGLRAGGQAAANRAAARGAQAQQERLLELIEQIQSADTTTARLDQAARSLGALQAARGISGSQLGGAEQAAQAGQIIAEDQARREAQIAQILSQDVFSAASPGDLPSPFLAGVLGGIGSGVETIGRAAGAGAFGNLGLPGAAQANAAQAGLAQNALAPPGLGGGGIFGAGGLDPNTFFPTMSQMQAPGLTRGLGQRSPGLGLAPFIPQLVPNRGGLNPFAAPGAERPFR